MQIRLTVLGPRSGRGCDVLVTAPAGTALSAVAGALASAAGSAQPGGRSAGASVALYAGAGRLDPNAVLGVPPLVDGALLSLHAPAEQHGDHGQYGRFGQYGRPPADLAALHVVGGPDAGGVHLLQGGQARIGRSAEADVPLDDPDVSRLHCVVAVGPDGGVTVADLGSTNGTVLGGSAVGGQPVAFPPAVPLRIGESTLRLSPAHRAAAPPLATSADNDGHLRVWPRGTGEAAPPPDGPSGSAPAPGGPGPYPVAPWGPAESAGAATGTHGRGLAADSPAEGAGSGRRATGERPRQALDEADPRGGVRGAIGAWARRLAGPRSPAAESAPDGPEAAEEESGEAEALRERWPDPASVLLTALGPGRRLWERGPGHPDALTVRLGTADLPAPDGRRLLRAVPCTVDLRAPATSALTLAGPRPAWPAWPGRCWPSCARCTPPPPWRSCCWPPTAPVAPTSAPRSGPG